MIRYINLKNYRSFTDLSFDMTGKNGVPKKMIIMYGENGVGKTNLINVIDTLYNSFQTLNLRNFTMKLLEKEVGELDPNKLSLLSNIMDISYLVRENKTIDSEDNMRIEIGFSLCEKNGTYSIEFNNERIVEERLEYVLNKNKVVLYDVNMENRKLNSQIASTGYLLELNNMLDKYWGKHSVMAILFSAIEEYTTEFINDALSEQLCEVVEYFKNFTAFLVKNKVRKGNIESASTVLHELDEGIVDDSDEERINHTEKLISNYFKDIYLDVKKVFYSREKAENRIKYTLYFRRLISGKEVDVRYDEESCGTRNLLALLPYFLAAMENKVVAIDEIDNGIHDILLSSLIKNLEVNIAGQLVMTTHNTMFLEDYDLKDCVYFIVSDEKGMKEVKSINSFGYRIQPNSNVMTNYLKGRFSKSPWNGTNIDFKKLLKIDKEKEEKAYDKHIL